MDAYMQLLDAALPQWDDATDDQGSNENCSKGLPQIAYIAVNTDRLHDAIEILRAALPPGSEIRIQADAGLAAVPEQTRPIAEFSPRQRQILSLLRLNLSNKDIARRLDLSHFTVRNAICQMLRDFNVSSRQEIIRQMEDGPFGFAHPFRRDGDALTY
jgi:DNA-binding NarL/FixJ family response regulator